MVHVETINVQRPPPLSFVISATRAFRGKSQIEISKCNTILKCKCLQMAMSLIMNPDQLVSICISNGFKPWNNIMTEPEVTGKQDYFVYYKNLPHFNDVLVRKSRNSALQLLRATMVRGLYFSGKLTFMLNYNLFILNLPESQEIFY